MQWVAVRGASDGFRCAVWRTVVPGWKPGRRWQGLVMADGKRLASVREGTTLRKGRAREPTETIDHCNWRSRVHVWYGRQLAIYIL